MTLSSNAPPASSIDSWPPRSTSSEGSEATTPDRSSSDPPAPSSPKEQPPETDGSLGSLGIRYEHRILIVGATRSGKSRLARELFLSAAPPRLVIDPRDSELTDVPGAVTFRQPAELRQLEEAETLRYVPRDPSDKDAFDKVYAWAFDHYPRWVWTDEPDDAMSANRFPRHANIYVVQGAKRGLGHLCCSTAPLWLMKSLYRNLQHLVLFDMPVAEDRRYVAANAGIPLADFEAAMAEAAALTKATPDGPKGGFVWWEQLTRTLTILPPLDLDS